MVFDWYKITFESLQGLWNALVLFVPQLIGSLIVFIVGWFIATAVGKIVAQILDRIKFNELFAKEHFKQALEKAELKVDPSEFIGGIFKWVLVIVFLLAAVEILGLSQFAIFLQSVIAYLPNVLVAAFIFVVAVIIAEFVGKILRATIEGAQMGSGHYVVIIVKWSIWIFTLIAVLLQLQVARELLIPIVQGLIYFLVIAGGLAFGLGGKDAAAEILNDLRRKLKG